jgi:hypothetical protein
MGKNKTQKALMVSIQTSFALPRCYLLLVRCVEQEGHFGWELVRGRIWLWSEYVLLQMELRCFEVAVEEAILEGSKERE